MFRLEYCDRSGARPAIAAGVLRWSEGVPITARMLISERVRGESERFDTRGEALPLALISAVGSNRATTLDEAEAIALRGFSANRFFLIVDRRQITDLDEPFLLKPTSSVVFLRLTPLKGG